MNTKPYESVHIRMIKFLSVCLIVPMLSYCCYSYMQIPAKRCTHSEINSAAIPM